MTLSPLLFLSLTVSLCSAVISNVQTGVIDIPGPWYIHTLNDVSYPVISLHYDMSFPRHKCCPVMYVASFSTDFPCYNHSAVQYESIVLNNLRILSVDSRPLHKSGCVYIQDIVRCQGVINMQAHEPRQWKAFLTYECKSPQGLYINYTFTVNTTDNYRCEPLENHTCQQFYNYTTLPNYFGYNTQEDAEKLYRTVLVFRESKCHQHIEEALCRTTITECRNGRPYVPCREVCEPAMLACGSKLTSYGISKIPCQQLPDSEDPEICITKDVVCPELTAPESGVVTVNGTGKGSIAYYTCNKGHHWLGDTTVSVCQISGEWTPIDGPMLCFEDDPTDGLIALVCVVVMIASVIIICPIMYFFRREIKILVYVKLLCCKNRETNLQNGRNYDAFVSYAQSQRDFVNDEMLPTLEAQNPQLNVCIPDLHFQAGERITDNIINAIAASCRVVALVTPDFLDSHWCLFEFQQAHLRVLEDPNFDLILVLMQPRHHLNNIPPDMKAYLNTWTYLDRTDGCFWEKLIQALSP